jgi:glucose/arabinose dehydrogenase
MHTSSRAARSCASVALLAAALLAAGNSVAATLPAGFTDNQVATVGAPTAMAFTPDGRLLVTTQPGALRVVANGVLQGTPALQFAVANICTNSERGLLGVAVDPNFGFNGYVYLFYTANKSGNCVNRVSRFTLPTSNVVNPLTEVVLLDDMPSPAGNHNGGDLQMGTDATLYVSVGDGGTGGASARSTADVLGKILRIRLDGSIPSSNPYAAAPGSRRCADPAGPVPGTGPCREIVAYGLRNPFRIAFRHGTDEFFINDVGQGTWEEINRGQFGADYGWNLREGPCVTGSTTNCPPPPVDMTDPIYAYTHGAGCNSITGGAFVPARRWPANLRGSYLFADFVCGTMFSLAPNGAAWAAATFGTAFGSYSVTAMTFGPAETARSLYYAQYAGGGQIRRIDWNGAQSFAKQDLDGNVNSDLAWSRADGTIALWMMSGGGITSSAGYAVPGWTLVGTGDFNGDGRADLVFQNAVTPQIAVWLMNGGAIVGSQAYSSGGAPLVTVADLNGDGIDDFVQRFGIVLVLAILNGDGTRKVEMPLNLGAEWQFAAKGDVNGDGNEDLIWRRADGTTVVWFMNGIHLAGSALWVVGTEWTLRATGDLDGDGKADLIWRRNDGTVVFWFMDGANIVGSGTYLQSTAWDVEGTADFNGDGRADIVWRSTSGAVAIWLMDGGAIVGSVAYPVGPEWSVVGLK